MITALEKAKSAAFFSLGKQTELTKEMRGFAKGHLSNAIEHSEKPEQKKTLGIALERLDSEPFPAIGLIDMELKKERRELRNAFAKCIKTCILPPKK
ncbi:hypothetical protein E3J84_06000 [Candidatus Aerophobetes bacterium]|uniref:Uncharacterized protein n=1 Tax=Aerophobetes bacterium TaxID=2030807 RepID=A0A523RS90_UNCAE|nr:MAG: hypothetical protein E3J84_06000 [Candidatus Aerophobetes bacterium]